MRISLMLLAAAACCCAQTDRIAAERIRADVRFLSSDLLEGRGVGARGGQLASEHIATQFAIAGARPAGDDGTYFQKVPLVGIDTKPGARATASARGRTVALRWLDDLVGTDERQKPAADFAAEAVFVGHGIVAPEFGWDDYKGADVRGKIVLLFTNEPDSNDPKFFGGRALTYYGRWTYKYEEALRHGALACIILHTDATAGYGWSVVRNSWGREQSYVKLGPKDPALAFAGWFTNDASARVLALAGQTPAGLLKTAGSRDFRPMPLGIRIRIALQSTVREQDTRNVIAKIEGSDAALKSQAVVLSAHWDHLGIGMPVNGDQIYNGAVDNATGCGILIELARAWAVLEKKPRRTALFIALTAEEAGLRGSEYYAAHPVVPDGQTAAAINFDGFLPLGRMRDVVVTGAERTTLWPAVERLARQAGLVIRPDPEPEQGHFYRSDHFSFARAGVPSFSVSEGVEVAGKPPGYGERLTREFDERHYHQPSDQFHEDWDFSGLAELARFGMALGIEAANEDRLPTWKAGDEFLPARQKSGVR